MAQYFMVCLGLLLEVSRILRDFAAHCVTYDRKLLVTAAGALLYLGFEIRRVVVAFFVYRSIYADQPVAGRSEESGWRREW